MNLRFSAIHYLANAKTAAIILLDKIKLDSYLTKPGHRLGWNKLIRSNI